MHRRLFAQQDQMDMPDMHTVKWAKLDLHLSRLYNATSRP